MNLLIVAGARPNFMKIAPLVHVLKNEPEDGLTWKLVHTGQHYDYTMSKAFFDDLEIPEPHYFLNVGSGSHAVQTAKIMVEFEKVCLDEHPDAVLVVGDVNSTLACSITAKKLNIDVVHVEAGLRSGDMQMPEEINRIVTDSISDYLFVSEKSGLENLKAEGKSDEKVFFTGNIMIDTLLHNLDKVRDRPSPGAEHAPFAVMTLHRPSNVDDKEKFTEILEALQVIAKEMTLFFPIHPRTKKQLEAFGLESMLDGPRFHLMPPLPYLEFLTLWKDASLLLTDSGGLQEESTALGIPCITIRENTERPITVEEGTNILAGTTKQGILDAFETHRSNREKQGRIPELWDGKTAQRILEVLRNKG